MILRARWIPPLLVSALWGCSSEAPPTVVTELPPPAERPEDPGLSFSPGCLAEYPIENPIAPGSLPVSGIPALIDPPFLKADEVTYLNPDDYVFGVEIRGRFFAFPARILNYHEVVTFSVDMSRYTATW